MVVGGSEGVSMAFMEGGGVDDREFASLTSSVSGTTSLSLSSSPSSSTPASSREIFSGAGCEEDGAGSGAGTGSAENES